MKIVQLDPNEIEYCSTLEWEPLMIYLEKKYGIKFVSYKWVSDDGDIHKWEENAAIGFQNFREHFGQTFFGEY